jgi:hypothetical protein
MYLWCIPARSWVHYVYVAVENKKKNDWSFQIHLLLRLMKSKKIRI